MGTDNRGNNPTQKLPDFSNGNWENPAVAAENQRYLAAGQGIGATGNGAQVAAPPAPSAGIATPYTPARVQTYAQPVQAYRPASAHKPVLGTTRRLLCILLTPLALLTGLAGALAYWADTNLVNTQRFTELTAPLATDTEFQQALSSSVTDDIMASDTVATYLGDGNSTSVLGGVQNWLYDQTESIINSAITSAVTSEDFPALWQQVITDTHAYNFAGESRPAQLDLSSLYDAAGTEVSSTIGFSLDTASLPGRTVALDTAEGTYPINQAINTLIWFADSWVVLVAISAGLALLSFLLWPRHRFVYLAITAFIAAALLWLAAVIAGGLSLTSGLNLPTSTTAVLFVQKVAEIMTASYADFHYQLALYALITAVVLTLLAILSAILRLTARATTARTR